MKKATLTISFPRTMKKFIEEGLRERRFSTPGEYVRPLIGGDQDMMGKGDVGPLPRRAAAI